MLTLLDLWRAKPSRVAGQKIPRTESNTQRVDERRAELYAKCVGSLIYLSIDRKDIRYETKELARHMRDPREVDFVFFPSRSAEAARPGTCYVALVSTTRYVPVMHIINSRWIGPT